LTVMIAMGGMFLAGNATFSSFAVGTILVVAVAMLGSVTFLPAMLSKLGDNVERLKVPIIGNLRHRNHGESRVWGWILDRVLAKPVLSVVLAGGILIALAIPALNMHTINPGVAGLPRDLKVMQTYDRIQAAFPGGPLPATVVVKADDVTAPKIQHEIKAMTDKAIGTGQMSGPITTRTSPDKTVELPMQANGTDTASNRALATLRDDVIPSTIHGAEANVTGMTAGSKDFNDTMKAHLPFVFAFVLGLAFILLLVTFRSVVVPL